MSESLIFISYRVKDAQIEARLLYADLANHFGRDVVFLDEERINPGDQWPEELKKHVLSCKVLLVLVKKGVVWAGHDDTTGEYRINVPEDWVRLEIEIAKREKKTIIPVFLDRGRFPAKSVLPEELHFLDVLQYETIQTSKWKKSVTALIEDIEKKGVQPQKKPTDAPVSVLDDYPLPADINPFHTYKEPYIGLRYFDREAAPLFFGRTHELNAFFSLIERPETRLILVHGHSGVGKSSFLAAGVLPRLEQQIPVHYERRDKTRQLDSQLAELLQNSGRADKRRVFILDQAEEMFTDPVRGERDEFAKKLHQALQDHPDDAFVLAFRSDYLTDVHRLIAETGVPYEEIRLDPLDRAAIVEAIEGVKKNEKLARLYQMDFDDNFARKVAEELVTKETAQVSAILQSRLQKIYIAARDARPPNDLKVRLRWEDYEKLVNEAHAEFELLDAAVESVQQQCPDADKKAILETLDQFVINRETAGAKSKQELQNAEDPLLQALLKVNLLTELRSKEAIRLAHDVLAPVVRRRYQEELSAENERLTAQNFELLWQNLHKGLEALDFEAARQALTEAAALHFYPKAYDLAPLAFELAYVFLWADKAVEGKALLRIFLDLQKHRNILYPPLAETSDTSALLAYLRQCDPNTFMDLEKKYFPTMIPVEGGIFVMGGNEFKREQPIHQVTVSDFAIAQTPTTWHQFGIFCLETGFKVPYDQGWGRGNRPLMNVSWEDAQQFCYWLSRKRGQHFRLPTEAEWEYAARGGRLSKGYRYSGSNDLDEVGWYTDNSNYRTHPVGQKRSNELGLYDMSGNVWEWCEDDWHGNYTGAPTDGQAWVDSPRGSLRVHRGGSWLYGARHCRVASRPYWTPARHLNHLGFRLALQLPR
ncbi:MAG: SUMF1/EgtB/PvdO family nonheme iron enzyme [Saprospiraceae bacterium]|nr:SUMF1/EgtB/PvdO family nonheme iron enzyme [Saprospiraceae bacterium]